VDICFLLVIAGLDTVAASLSCIVFWLARNQEAQQRLREQPETLPRVIEELMRFESPVPGGGRYAAEDIDVNGTLVPSGTSLQMSWACANVDEAAFAHPLEVDVERTENRHIAFASGFHRCLGSHLARLELRTAMEVLHERTSGYWIPEGSNPRVHNLGVRTVEHLPLAFEVPQA
jgi:cytochrome P450